MADTDAAQGALAAEIERQDRNLRRSIAVGGTILVLMIGFGLSVRSAPLPARRETVAAVSAVILTVAMVTLIWALAHYWRCTQVLRRHVGAVPEGGEARNLAPVLGGQPSARLRVGDGPWWQGHYYHIPYRATDALLAGTPVQILGPVRQEGSCAVVFTLPEPAWSEKGRPRHDQRPVVLTVTHLSPALGYRPDEPTDP